MKIDKQGRNNRHLAYLDGIRGVAAFGVFLHHFCLAFYTAYFNFYVSSAHLPGNLELWYGKSVFSVITNGNFFVCIFFVLSGFVLSQKYFSTQSLEDIISGAQRRFFRLYIPVAFTITISCLLVITHLYYNRAASVVAHSEWWFGPFITYPDCIAAYKDCMLYRTMFFGDSTFDTTLWTMSIEFFGSLLVFAYLALTHGIRNRVAALLIMLVYCYLTDSVFICGFVLGISLNYIIVHQGKLNKYLVMLGAPALFLFSLFLGSFPSTGDRSGTIFEHMGHSLYDYTGWFHIIGGYLLVLSFTLSIRMQKIISMRLFRFLGYISFSLYLLHPLVMSSIGSYVFLKMYKGLGYNHTVVLVFGICTAVTVAASWLMARYIDNPGTKFARYVYDRFFKAKPVLSAVGAGAPDEAQPNDKLAA